MRGLTSVAKRGKTPVLQPVEVRLLLDSIDTSAVGGLRDRALLGVMIYSFARVSTVVHMDVDDYDRPRKRWWLRLRDKGGKYVNGHSTFPQMGNLQLPPPAGCGPRRDEVPRCRCAKCWPVCARGSSILPAAV